MLNLLAIFLGGGLGSLARFGVGKLVTTWYAGNFPAGTLGANILSCIVLGLALGAWSDKVLAEPWLRAFLVVGFCGGFSTFSTFSYETQLLLRHGHTTAAILNIAISVVFCVALLFWLTRNSA